MTDQEYIRAYLNGELDASEAQAFEQRMDSDEAFGSLVAEEAVKYGERWELKQRLEEIRKQGERPQRTWSFARVAILITVLTSACILAWLLWPKPDYPELFAEHFEPYRALSEVRGDQDEHWTASMDDYRAGNYEDALKDLTEISEPKYLRDFYIGMCHLSVTEPEFDEAVTSLQRAVEGDHDYQQQARWYLALSYLGKGDMRNAKAALGQIAKQDGAFHQKEAAALLKQL